MMKTGLILVLAMLLLSFDCGVGISQRRTGQAPVAAQMSDAVVFGDREWIYYLAPNSSVPRKLVKGTFPALSPDHHRVAYCAPTNPAVSAAPTGALMLFDLASGKSSVVLKANAWLSHPKWTPNEEMIAFVFSPSGQSELHVIRPDGSQHRKIIAAEEQGVNSIFNPAWSIDGRSIYFQDMTNLVEVSTLGKVRSMTLLGAITAEREAVTSSDSFVPCPTDANLLAFTKSVPGTRLFERTFGEPNTALFLYDVRTKTRKRLTPVDLLAIDPVWSRDGNFIYFSGYRDREGRAAYPFKIYRIARDGTGLTQIAAGETPGT